MKTMTSLIILTLLLNVSPVSAGYRELKADFDAYAPSDNLYDDIGSFSRPENIAATFQLPEKNEGDDLKKTVYGFKKQWEQRITDENETTRFFVPGPDLLKSLIPAENNDVAVRMVRKRLSLETLEILTLLRNPWVQMAKRNLRAEIETFSQVDELDEILRQYTAFTEGIMNGTGPMKNSDSMRMKYPFPGTVSLKGNLVNQAVKAASEDVEIARKKALTDIRRAYWNLLFVFKARKVTAETLKLYRRLETVSKTRYRAGKTSFQDVVSVTIRMKMLEEDLVTLREKQKNLSSDLLRILNLPPETVTGQPENLSPDFDAPSLETLYRLASRHRQEIRKIRFDIARMELMIEMAETMTLSPYTFNFSVFDDEAINQVGTGAGKSTFDSGERSSAGSGRSENSWYGTKSAWLRQTNQRLYAAREKLKAVMADTDNEVRTAWFNLDRARREAALYRDTIVGLSRSALEVATRGYESGTVSFADVIRSYATWLDVGLALAQKQSEIGIAKAQLDFVVGKSVQRRSDSVPE